MVSDIGLAPNRRQVIIWNNDALVYLGACVSLGLKQLTPALHILFSLYNIHTRQ